MIMTVFAIVACTFLIIATIYLFFSKWVEACAVELFMTNLHQRLLDLEFDTDTAAEINLLLQRRAGANMNAIRLRATRLWTQMDTKWQLVIDDDRITKVLKKK